MRRVVGWVGGVAGTALAVLAAAAVLPAIAQTGGFEDVAAGAYYSAPVEELAGLGVLTGCEGSAGFDDGRFCPGEPMDRKTMAVWVVRVLEGEDPPPGMSRFPDANALGVFWAPFIERMAELGVTTGCGDGTDFCPNGEVTRAHAAVFLSRAFDLPDGPDPGFSDVPDGAWYYDEAAALAASGITQGCGDGTMFCPHQAASRAQMATFLSRARQLTQAATDATSPTQENSATSVGAGSGGSSNGGSGRGGGQGTTTTPVARTAVTASFGQSTYEAAEGGSVLVSVELSEVPERPVTVDLTVTGNAATSDDYRVSSTSVTFAADQRTATFRVTAFDDSVDDDDESVKIGFGTLPVGMTATSPTSIEVALVDNDDPQVTVSFEKDSYTAREGSDAVTVTVKLSADPEREVMVPLSVTRGGGAIPADYEVSPMELTFGDGQTTADFEVTAVDDVDDDDGETVTIRFGTLPNKVTAANQRAAQVFLDDDDDDPLGRVTMRLPAGCVLRDLITGNEMPYASYYSGCASLHIPRRNAHYYRLVVRQEGAVTLAVSASTASHLLIRSASGEVIARYDEPGEIEFYQLSLTRTLEAGTYVIEVAAQWSHFSDHGRGHTLRYSGSTIARPGAYKLAGLSITDVNLAHFAAGTTEYSRNIAADVRTVTVTPTATLDDAEVTVMPPDANASLGGRQVDLEADGVTEVTVAVKSPMIVDAETMYRVVLTQLAGTTAPLSDDPGLVSLSFEGIDIGDFSSDKTGYTYPLGFYERLNGTTVTMSVTPAGGATWTANRSDEDEDVDGHQLSIDGDDVILVTVTSQDNANTRVYRVAPEAPVTRDASKDICTSCEVRYPYGLWSDGESMITMSRPANTLHVFDIETKRQQSTLRLTRPRYNGWNADESKGFWTDGETVWVLHQEDGDWEPNDNNVLYAYSLETQARIPASDIQFPDEWGSPTALWIDGERMYMATFWDVLHIYEFSADASDIDTIRYDSGHPDGPPGGNTLAIWSDGTTLYLAIDNAWVRAYDAESGRRIPGLDFRTSPHPTNTNWSHPEPIGIWSDGRTMWVIDVARGYPEAYSMLENARLWKLSVSGGDIGYFHNGKFDYDVEVPAGTTSIAITAEAAFGGGSSSVVFSGTDADDQTHGHQATLAPGEDTAVTITVTAPNGTDTEVYTVRITHAS